MPLYEYHCDACGKNFEVIQKFSETSETCRLCGKGPVHRQVSAPGIQFKGTGWYITDYAQKGKSSDSAAGESKTKTDSASSDSSTKSETPAATTTTTEKS